MQRSVAANYGFCTKMQTGPIGEGKLRAIGNPPWKLFQPDGAQRHLQSAHEEELEQARHLRPEANARLSAFASTNESARWLSRAFSDFVSSLPTQFLVLTWADYLRAG